MPGMDKAAGRVVALIVLLLVAAAALRGYLPAAERGPRQQKAENPTALAVVIILLGVSLTIIAISIISRIRNRRVMAGSIGALSTGLGGGKGRPRWRVLLVGLAVLSAWVLLVWLLRKSVGQYSFDSFAWLPGEPGDAPATGTAPPPRSTAQRPEGPQPKSGADLFGYLAAAALGLALLVVAGMVSTRGRRGSSTPPDLDGEGIEPGLPSEPETLVRAAERGLAEVGDQSRGPREAIIGCYAVMEGELAHVPEVAPQDCDTPTEVLARAVEHHALSGPNAAQLVNLFAEARFSPHLMTEAHRQDAIRILRLVLAELRSRV